MLLGVALPIIRSMESILLATIIPALPAVIGLLFGIAKDGSPFNRSFWTS